MRAIAFVTRLIDEGKIPDGSLKRMLIHAIEADDVMQKLGITSKYNTDGEFLGHLHDTGYNRTDAWAAQFLDRIGVESTVDIRAKYL
jgi:NTE family protein